MSKPLFKRMLLVPELQYKRLLSLSSPESIQKKDHEALKNTLEINEKLTEDIQASNEAQEKLKKRPHHGKDDSPRENAISDAISDGISDGGSDMGNLNNDSYHTAVDSDEGEFDDSLPPALVQKCQKYFGGKSYDRAILLIKRIFMSGHVQYLSSKWINFGKNLKISNVDFFDIIELLLSRKKGLNSPHYMEFLQFLSKAKIPIHMISNPYAKAIIVKGDFSSESRKSPKKASPSKGSPAKSSKKSPKLNTSRSGAAAMPPKPRTPRWLKNEGEIEDASEESD